MNEIESAPPLQAIDPERAAYLTRTMVAVAAALVGQMLDDLARPSTDSPSSLTDRMMMGALRPWIPKLRDTLLAKLSEADPVMVERMLGATATALESILSQAPGEPLPRFLMDWDPADGHMVLIPVAA